MAADHVRHAVDELRDIAGDAAINDALHDRAGACGRFFGRFCDDRTSRGKSSCHFLAHQIDGEVPWRERSDWPDRLLQNQRALSRWPDKNTAIAALGFLGEIVELRGAGKHLGAGFGKRLALLSGQQNGNYVSAFANVISNLAQDCRAGVDVHGTPMRKSFCRCGKSLVKVGCSCQR